VSGGWPGRGTFSSTISCSIRPLPRVGARRHVGAGLAQPHQGASVQNSSTVMGMGWSAMQRD
jgi:hypothetical protein